MSTTPALDTWAQAHGVAPEMAVKVFGYQPLALCIDMQRGQAYLGVMNTSGVYVDVATWDAVQGEDLVRRISLANQIIESGVGSLRGPT